MGCPVGFVLPLSGRRSLYTCAIVSSRLSSIQSCRTRGSARFSLFCRQSSSSEKISHGVFIESTFNVRRRTRYDLYAKKEQKAHLKTGGHTGNEDVGNGAVLRSTTDEKSGETETKSYISSSKAKAETRVDEGDPLKERETKPKDPDGTMKPLMFKTHQELMDNLLKLTGDPLEEEGGRIVTYRGSLNARIMIIGEAPGEQEDIQGVPFVGRSGQLLDTIFWSCALDKHVYITNAVKRRPENNRTPTTKEIAYYRPWLLEEIRLISPGIIVLTGNISLRALLDEKKGITKMRGQWVTWIGISVMPVFHPAYLLRNESKKSDMWRDINEIREQFKELYPEIPLGPIQSGKKEAQRSKRKAY